MAIVVRPAGYTGSLQRIVWAQGDDVPVTAYLWGGGGGGGGNDAATNGGVGGGAGYTQVKLQWAARALADRIVPVMEQVEKLAQVTFLILISTQEMQLLHLQCLPSSIRPIVHF